MNTKILIMFLLSLFFGNTVLAEELSTEQSNPLSEYILCVGSRISDEFALHILRTGTVIAPKDAESQALTHCSKKYDPAFEFYLLHQDSDETDRSVIEKEFLGKNKLVFGEISEHIYLKFNEIGIPSDRNEKQSID